MRTAHVLAKAGFIVHYSKHLFESMGSSQAPTRKAHDINSMFGDLKWKPSSVPMGLKCESASSSYRL